MFPGRAAEVFGKYLRTEIDGNIYVVEKTTEFFAINRKNYEANQNLIKSHEVYIRSFFETLNGDFSGLSFVGKMYLVRTDDEMVVEDFLQQLLKLCDTKEQSIIYQICKLFGIKLVRQMKDSGIAWVGEIPQDWQTMPLYCLYTERKNINVLGKQDNLLSLSYGKIIRKDINTSEGLLPSNYNSYNIVECDDIVIRPTDLQNDKRSLRTGLAKERGIITSAYITLKPKQGVKSRFFHYLLHSYDISKVFYNMGNGVRQGLNYDEFAKLVVLVPSDLEQQRIVDFLDSECEKIDKLKADIQAQIDSLEEYKKSVITEAVTHGLNPSAPMKDSGIIWIGQIPSNWAIGRIGGLYELRKQKVSDKEYMPLSVTMKGILPQLDTVAKTNDGDNRKLVRKGDFAINSRSDRRGSCGISNYDGSVSLINTILKPRNIMNANYYNWLFHTPIFADEFYKWGHGIVDDLWTTNWQEMKRITIPVPPLDEQKAIAEYLDHKCAEIEQIIADRKTQFETLDDYKQSLIYEYVTGKKEVV